MENRKIAVLDSGVGGLSTLMRLKKLMPNEEFIYFGDNKNAPYGNKSLRELKSITINNLIYIMSFNPKALIVACNTLSVSLYSFIKNFCPFEVFGVFPPIETFIMKGYNVFLLSTPITSKSVKINHPKLRKIELPFLAKKIEDNLFNLKNIDINNEICKIKRNLIDNYNDKNAVLIFGCTHYYFVKNKIIDYLKPPLITSGDHFTAKIVKSNIVKNKNLKINRKNQVIFIGENKILNSKFFYLVVNKFQNF